MSPEQVSGLVFWGVIVFLGLMLFTGMSFLFAIWETLQARRWIETPCTIVLSQTDHKTGGKIYWNVVYTYNYQGKEYSSRRFEIMDYESDKWEPIADLVDSFPPGRKTVCYVDPRDPENSILSKRIRGVVWLTAIPVALVLLGIGGLLAQLPREKDRFQVEPAEQLDPVDIEDDEPARKGAIRYFELPSPRYPSPPSLPSPRTARHT